MWKTHLVPACTDMYTKMYTLTQHGHLQGSFTFAATEND